MNFQKIPSVIDSKTILDEAFRKARIKGRQKNIKGNWLQIIRRKESLKLDVIKDLIEQHLQRIITDFPDLQVLPEFYIKLMNLTIDLPQLRRSLSSIDWAVKTLRQLHRESVRNTTKEKDRTDIKAILNKFYGRTSSIIKQIDKDLKFLEKSRQVMRSYPDIKEMFTVCIYGFPNVGKTTLLNELTKTKAKTAAYAFTTKTINAGYFTINDKTIQVLDLPGTLARDDKMNNIEKQADLVLKELADLVIYVYDITEQCGFSLENQKELFKKISGNKILTYLSKKDLMDKVNWKEKHYSIKKNKWLGKSIEQRILVQDLEHINNAIAELRQYQETILKKAKVPLPPAYVDFKHHLPIILDSPENLHFFEEELAGVNQALVDLETQPFSPVKRVQDIPPLPPKQNNCSIRNYLIKTSIEESPAQQSITSQLSPEEKVRASKPKQNPKSLLDRLRYGVIELQDKWAEVKGRLNDIDYPNLEVKRQLSKLDLELKKFKEISTPFKTSLLTPKAQERVRSKIKQIKRRINKERTILPELLVIENNLKNLRNYKLQKVRVLKSISAFGKSTILSSRQQNRIHQATKEFISNISNKDLKNYELLNLDKY